MGDRKSGVQTAREICSMWDRQTEGETEIGKKGIIYKVRDM